MIKNKLFFFGNFQGTRFDAPGTETVSVAPESWRHGDLSSVEHHVVHDPATGQPFAGNQIPAGRISPIAAGILNNTALYPLPNRNVTGVTGNYVGDRLETIRADQADVRVDWSPSNNDKVFGRFSCAEFDRSDRQAARSLCCSAAIRTRRSRTWRSTGTA